MTALVAEKLGQAAFRDDYAAIDDLRQRELLVDAELERSLDEVVDELSFEYGVVRLDDRIRKEIRVARFRNLPPGRLRSGRHRLGLSSLSITAIALSVPLKTAGSGLQG